ncbi:hypothetical protein BMS3Abin07_02498 [bacterium BMS3Abin07]|nr:hypothetical protein BMS3Abin07_02498 [bacterium BMS3Abin07]
MQIRSLFHSDVQTNYLLPMEDQLYAWQAANRKMRWGIGKKEFNEIDEPPQLTKDDHDHGYTSVCIFYGFGDNGSGHADSVFSGKLAWDYACRTRKKRVWQSPYINFDKPDAFRLRPSAPPQPRGFYFAKIQTGERFLTMPVSRARKLFNAITGFGPEGLQLLCITHPHFPDLMSVRRIPFMVLSDYDVAPYGFHDFFDVPQIFSSNGILGLGIGHVDQNYQGFGIPTIRL